MSNVSRLPDCYRKNKGSNNHKLLELNHLATKELRTDLQAVMEALDINQAAGKTLDLYGAMLDQQRGILNDEQYRYMQLARVGRNVVQGTYESIMSAMELMFNCGSGYLVLDDVTMSEDDQPCTVKLTSFPISILVSAGFTSRQAVQMIEMLLPVCVKLSADNFEGTFEFADTDGVYSKDAGFADIGQTFGGYFGLLLGEDYEGSLEFARFDTEYDASSGFADASQSIGGYLGSLIPIADLPI